MELPRAEEDFGSPTKHVVGNDSTVMKNKIQLQSEYQIRIHRNFVDLVRDDPDVG